MSQTISKVNPDDKKMKIDQFNLTKIIRGTIRGDQFLYIDSRSLLSLPSPYFILSLCLHLCPPRVGQIVGIDSYHINTFLKSLESSCKAKNYCSGITSSLMQPESQLQSIQCGGSSFLLDIFQLPFVLYVHKAYPHQQNVLERRLRQQNTLSDIHFVS